MPRRARDDVLEVYASIVAHIRHSELPTLTAAGAAIRGDVPPVLIRPAPPSPPVRAGVVRSALDGRYQRPLQGAIRAPWSRRKPVDDWPGGWAAG